MNKKYKMNWSLWMDPEDNSVTMCEQNTPHYGSDMSFEMHTFSTEADTLDKHYEMAKEERDVFLLDLERE